MPSAQAAAHSCLSTHKRTPPQVFADYEKATATIDALSKKVNKRVMQMFEKAEQEYTELKRKKDVVEGDKRKIEEVSAFLRAAWGWERSIHALSHVHPPSRCACAAPGSQVMEELDEKKCEALRQTWLQVNEDFGSIFSSLLPSTTAKLEPTEGQTFLDGECLRVCHRWQWGPSSCVCAQGMRSLSHALPTLLPLPAPPHRHLTSSYPRLHPALQAWRCASLLAAYGSSP
jgi:structural maintenance of chromosome 2